MNKIRKGDKVVVITGRDKGKRGTVLQPRRRGARDRRRRQRRQEALKPNPMKGHRRHRRQDAVDPRVERGDLQSGDRQGRPRRRQALQRRREEAAQDRRARRPRLPLERRRDQGLRGSHGAPEGVLSDKVVPDLMEQFGYKSTMQVPRITKIVLNMGVGEAVADKKVLDNAVERHAEDRRPEAGRHQGEEGDRRLQDPRRLADRLHGHAARRAHVRVPRPPRHHRAAARARLPRRARARVRRPRQLQHGRQGTDHLSRRSSTTRSTRCAA